MLRDIIWEVRSWLRRTWDRVRGVARTTLPNDRDTPEVRGLKLTVFLFVGIIGLMIVVGFATFALAVRGQEQTMVPNVAGKDLVAALLELQERELYARVQVQFSSSTERNTVLEQSPAPGTVVKAGKRVSLRVSKGPVLETVEDYVGRSIDEVRSYLQTLYASHTPNLVIDEPLYRQEKGVAPGIILEQQPKPGTQISGVTHLVFVVARGEGELANAVGNYVGLSFSEALTDLARSDLPFVFSVQKAAQGQPPGTVVAQTPNPETRITLGQTVQLVMTPPTSIGADRIFGLFRTTLPDYPILVDVRLDVITDTGRMTILAFKHAGGPLAIPYIVPDGSDIVLTVLENDKVQVAAEPFSF